MAAIPSLTAYYDALAANEIERRRQSAFPMAQATALPTFTAPSLPPDLPAHAGAQHMPPAPGQYLAEQAQMQQFLSGLNAQSRAAYEGGLQQPPPNFGASDLEMAAATVLGGIAAIPQRLYQLGGAVGEMIPTHPILNPPMPGPMAEMHDLMMGQTVPEMLREVPAQTEAGAWQRAAGNVGGALGEFMPFGNPGVAAGRALSGAIGRLGGGAIPKMAGFLTGFEGVKALPGMLSPETGLTEDASAFGDALLAGPHMAMDLALTPTRIVEAVSRETSSPAEAVQRVEDIGAAVEPLAVMAGASLSHMSPKQAVERTRSMLDRARHSLQIVKDRLARRQEVEATPVSAEAPATSPVPTAQAVEAPTEVAATPATEPHLLLSATWRKPKETAKAESDFRKLPDETEITVFHGTTESGAKGLRSGKVGPSPLHVAPTAIDAANYGPVVVTLKMKKGDLSVSPTSSNPKADPITGFFNSSLGAVLQSGKDIRIVSEARQPATPPAVEAKPPAKEVIREVQAKAETQAEEGVLGKSPSGEAVTLYSSAIPLQGASKMVSDTIKVANKTVSDYVNKSLPTLVQSTKAVSSLAPKSGKKLARTVQTYDDVRADIAGPAHMMNHDALKGLSGAKGEIENAILSKAGRATPMNENVAQSVAKLKQLDTYVTGLAKAAGVRMADGSEFREAENHLAQYWSDATFKHVRSKRGDVYKEAVEHVVTTLKNKGLRYDTASGKAVPLEEGQKISDADYRKQAASFLDKSRDFYREGEPYLNPLEGKSKDIKATTAKGVQFHRLIEWPRHFLVPNLAEAHLRHIDRILDKSAEAWVFGPDNAKINQRYNEFVKEVVSEADKRAQKLDPESVMSKVKTLTGPHLYDPTRAREIAEIVARRLIGRTTKNPTLEDIKVDPRAQAVYSGLRGLAAVRSLGIGSGFTLANPIWGLFNASFRLGLVPSIVAGVKSIPAAVHNVPGLRDIPAIGDSAPWRKAVEYGALEHKGLTDLIADAPIPRPAKTLLFGVNNGMEAGLRTMSATAAEPWMDAQVAEVRRIYNEAGPKEPGRSVFSKSSSAGRDLVRMGLTHGDVMKIAAGQELTPAQRRQIVRGAVGVTQFMIRPADMPLKMTDPGFSQVWLQFFKMAYKNMQNTAGYTVSEMGYGNYKPLAKLMILGTAAGWTMDQARRWLSGQPNDEDKNFMVEALHHMVESVGLIDRPAGILADTTEGQLWDSLKPAAVGAVEDLAASAYKIAKEHVKSAKGDPDANVGRAYRSLLRWSGTGRTIDARLADAGLVTPYHWTRKAPYSKTSEEFYRRFDKLNKKYEALDKWMKFGGSPPSDAKMTEEEYLWIDYMRGQVNRLGRDRSRAKQAGISDDFRKIELEFYELLPKPEDLKNAP